VKPTAYITTAAKTSINAHKQFDSNSRNSQARMKPLLVRDWR